MLGHAAPDVCEDGTGDGSAVLRGTRSARVVDENDARHFGIARREVAGKRNNVLPGRVATFRIHALCGARLAADLVAADSGERGSSFFADHFLQCGGNFGRGLVLDDAAHHGRLERKNLLAVRVAHRTDNLWKHHVTAVGDHRHAHGALQRGDRHLVTHGNTGDAQARPFVHGMNRATDLPGQPEAGALAEAEATDVFVEGLGADVHGDFGATNIGRLDEDVVDAE